MVQLARVLTILLVGWDLAHADVIEHHRIERITVFPFDVPRDARNAAMDSWWQVRDELTRSKRYLIATEDLLKKKSVFQPRARLQPADVIILSRLLDAQVIITGFAEGFDFFFECYDGLNGNLLWKKSIQMSQSIPLAEQIKPSSLKLIRDFLSDIPYQAYVVRDVASGQILREQESMQVFTIQIGEGSGAEIGDPVDVLRIVAQSLDPIFQGGAKIEVVATGRVLKVERTSADVELLKSRGEEWLMEESLVRLPREARRLRESSLGGLVYDNASAKELKSVIKKDESSVWTALTFVFTLAAFLIVGL